MLCDHARPHNQCLKDAAAVLNLDLNIEVLQH